MCVDHVHNYFDAYMGCSNVAAIQLPTAGTIYYTTGYQYALADASLWRATNLASELNGYFTTDGTTSSQFNRPHSTACRFFIKY